MAQHAIGARPSSFNTTGTLSSCPTGGPLLQERITNTPAMPEAGRPERWVTNKDEGKRTKELKGSMHRSTEGLGYGAYMPEMLAEATTGYAPNRTVDKSATMSDKGPGTFYREIPHPPEGNDEQRREFLEHGAFYLSARSDRSRLSFGNPHDHPRWDTRNTVRAEKLKKTEDIQRHVRTQQRLGAPGPRKTRLDLFTGPDRKRLIESGKLGAFDQTLAIHEARLKFRRQQRRTNHGKKALLSSGKHCEEALQGRDLYIDGDHKVMTAPTGPRNERFGVGVVKKRVGSHEQWAEQRKLLSSGDWGAFNAAHDPIEDEGNDSLLASHDAAQPTIYPSGRRDRALGVPAVGRPTEPEPGNGPPPRIRNLRARTIADRNKVSSSQIGQWLTFNRGGGGGAASLGGGDSSRTWDADGFNGLEGIWTRPGGGVRHWKSYEPHEPGDLTQRDVERAHREALTSGIVGSFTSSRGPRPTQAEVFNKQPIDEKLPTGAPTDGAPYVLKPGYYDAKGNHTDDFLYSNNRGHTKGRHPDDDDDDDDDYDDDRFGDFGGDENNDDNDNKHGGDSGSNQVNAGADNNSKSGGAEKQLRSQGQPIRLPAKQEAIDGWRAMALNPASGGGLEPFESEQPDHRSAKTSLLAAALFHDQLRAQQQEPTPRRPMTGRSFDERGLGRSSARLGNNSNNSNNNNADSGNGNDNGSNKGSGRSKGGTSRSKIATGRSMRDDGRRANNARRAKTAAVGSRATMEMHIAAGLDTGWSHCLRGQKW